MLVSVCTPHASSITCGTAQLLNTGEESALWVDGYEEP